MRLSAADVERLTPASRDRYVDFLRAFSIVVVVVGHWTIALIFWEDGSIFVHNVVGHQSGLWLATWVLQVMPLFFFVGGFSNSLGWGSVSGLGGSYPDGGQLPGFSGFRYDARLLQAHSAGFRQAAYVR